MSPCAWIRSLLCLSSGLIAFAVGGAAAQSADGGHLSFANETKVPLIIERVLRLGGEKPDELRGIAAWPGGGFVATGYTESSGAGAEDLWVVRFLPDGEILWEKTFGTDRRDEGFDVSVLPTGEIGVAGLTTRKRFWEDVWVLRLSRTGEKMWDRHLGGPDEDVGRAIGTMPFGGFIVAGDTISIGSGGFDAWLIHLDANGEFEWERTLGGGLDESVRAVSVLAEEGMIVAGETGSREVDQWDAWVARLEGEGYRLWGWSAGGEQRDRANAIAALPFGEFVMAGETFSKGAGGGDAWIVKLNAKGEVAWEHTVGGPGDDIVRAVVALEKGAMIAVGDTAGEAGNRTPWLVYLDKDGYMHWQYRFGGGEDITVTDAAHVEPATLLLSGTIRDAGKRDSDGWIAKISLLSINLAGRAEDD